MLLAALGLAARAQADITGAGFEFGVRDWVTTPPAGGAPITESVGRLEPHPWLLCRRRCENGRL